MGLFVFLLGAVSSLAIVFVLLVNFINKTEEKIQKEYDDTKQSLEEPDLQKVPLDSKKLHVQVVAVGSAEVAEWMYGIVRANMVFLFKSDLDVSASGVFCLDGAVLTVVRATVTQSSPWHKKNAIQITCPDRTLLYQSNTLLIYCESAREAESWYYSLVRGANLSIKKDVAMDQKAKKEQNHFKLLQTILKNADIVNASPSVSPAPSPTISPVPSPSPVPHSVHHPPILTRSASGSTLPLSSTTIPPPSSLSSDHSKIHSHLTWLNALLGRMFWNIHDAPEFSAFLTRKFNKKLLKVKKPAILKTVAICNVSFGPNLPMITSAHLDHIGPTGEVVVSGDLLYHGGFTLTVSIEIAIEVMGHSLAVPVVVTARVTSLHGRAVVCIPPPPSARVWFAFEREPTCEIDIDTAFGNAGKVANIPRIAKIVVNALKTELLKIIVLPNMEDFQLPKFKGQKGDKDVVSASTAKIDSTPSTSSTAIPTANPTHSLPVSSIPSSTPAPNTSLHTTSTPTSGTKVPTSTTHPSHSAPSTPSVLTRDGPASHSANHIDHKMIDEALEKLATKEHDTHT